MKSVLLSCVAAVGMVALPTSIAVAKSSTPVPMEHWAAPEFMSNVSLSPDGKYIAFIKAESQKGDNIIEVYETANMKKKPLRVGAKSMELQRFSWVGNSEMIVSFNQQVSKKIKGFNRGAFKSKVALFSVKTKKFEELNDDNFVIGFTDPLVNEPNHILVRFQEAREGQSRRAANYYRYNLKTGSKQLVLKGNQGLGGYAFDEDGNPRLASKFDQGSEEFVYLHRPVGGKGWDEYFRIGRDSFEQFSPAGVVAGEPNMIYVIAHNGEDRTGVYKFNLETKEFGELVFRHDVVDVWSLATHSNRWSNPDEVTGVVYGTDKFNVEWWDKEEEAIRRQFEAAIPNAHQVGITTRSRDGNVLVVRNSGPRDPGSFYLYNNGAFSKLGSINGLLKAEDLADVEYISYTARDGKTIPAYVTRPNGKGPFPLVVVPHGGPFVAEVIGYRAWPQMLANNGYMVLQPQYRGSQNYGLEFYKSAFIDGGQGGYKMQDDKDDGVQYLIDKGEVDADRVAMFGWSYGGYAALVAASREPNMYQCVIAGAAVADNNQQVNYYRNQIRGSQRVEQLSMWDDSISPIEEAAKVNVPMLVIHGSVDQRVPVSHSKKYVDELEKEGKSFEYIELKDADHFSNTLYYDHKMKAYPRMISFLKDDCGPGGL